MEKGKDAAVERFNQVMESVEKQLKKAEWKKERLRCISAGSGERVQNRDTDRQDIIKDTVLSALDWDLLDQIARFDEEVKLNALNERNYTDFLFNYEEYVRRYRP